MATTPKHEVTKNVITQMSPSIDNEWINADVRMRSDGNRFTVRSGRSTRKQRNTLIPLSPPSVPGQGMLIQPSITCGEGGGEVMVEGMGERRGRVVVVVVVVVVVEVEVDQREGRQTSAGCASCAGRVDRIECAECAECACSPL